MSMRRRLFGIIRGGWRVAGGGWVAAIRGGMLENERKVAGQRSGTWMRKTGHLHSSTSQKAFEAGSSQQYPSAPSRPLKG